MGQQLDIEVEALRARIRQFEEALASIKWRSIDRDNMEFSATITCFQMDRLNAAMKDRADG
jgi:hypothetical protein